jgi:hypothetical protein
MGKIMQLGFWGGDIDYGWGEVYLLLFTCTCMAFFAVISKQAFQGALRDTPGFFAGL